MSCALGTGMPHLKYAIPVPVPVLEYSVPVHVFNIYCNTGTSTGIDFAKMLHQTT